MFLDNLQEIEYIGSKEDYDKLHREDHIYVSNNKQLYLENIGICNVSVNGYAGKIPHFEISAINNNFHTCIKLYEPEYYLEMYQSNLTNNQIDELIEYLNSSSIGGLSIHDWLCIEWRNLNIGKKYNHYLDNDYTPDYSILKRRN